MVLLCGQLLAQTRTITGKVTDATGAPLVNASVTLKGVNGGTTTRTDGTFSLNVPASTKTIVISAIGLTTQEINITDRGEFFIRLVPNNKEETEVVVTGLSRQKRSQYSGAVAKISDDKIHDIPVGSFDGTFQGNAPGVQALSGSGQPGNASTVIIRGLGSIQAGSNPLYVIDGIPIEAANFIGYNPNDFVSVDILKDASASALYGSRGSAGVIVITTRRGQAGKMRLSVDQQFGITEKPHFTYTPFTTPQLLESQFELGSFFYNNGSPTGGSAAGLPGWRYNPKNPTFNTLPAATQAQYSALYDSISRINNTWDDQFFRTGHFSNTTLSLSGGTGGFRVFTSLGYYKEDGITFRTDLTRVTLRNNIDYNDDKLSFSLSSNLGYSRRNFQQSTQTNGLTNPFLLRNIQVPYALIKKPDGTYATGTGASFSGANELDEVALDQNYNDQIKATISGNAAYKLLRDIQVGMQAGIDYRETQNTQYGDPRAFLRVSSTSITGHSGFQFQSVTRFIQPDIRPYITYKRTIDRHDIDVTVEGEYVQLFQNGFNEQGFGVDPKRPNTPAAVTQGNAANQLYAVVGGSKTQNALLSGLVIGRYTFDKKYTLTGSFREDGASTLPAANRWNGFYSIGAIWEASQEGFLKAATAINTLRLRASYGGSGNFNNNPFADFGYLPTYTQGGYSGLVTLVASNPGNPNLKWESTYILNVGVDYGFFNSRLYGSLDVYNRRTTNAYAQLGLSATAGFGNNGSQNINAGIVSNKGFEYTINADIVRGNDFSWTVTVNGSYNKNKVVSLGGISSFTSGTSLIEVGKPLQSQYTVKWGGVDPATGKPQYYDLAGKLTNTYSASYQQNAFGTAIAPWNGGAGTTLRYKGIELSALFSYQKGSIKLNNTAFFLENPVGFMAAGYNQSSALKFWQKPGDIATTPSPLYGVQFTSQQLEDASFIRLRNIQLSYSMPKNLLSKTKAFSSVRFYLLAQNLAIWTKWRGLDPEAGATNIVLGEFPNPRTLTGGIQVTF